MLPPELKQTVSQALAASENRPLIEACLWQKVVSVCVEAGVPRGSDAPDFICAASAAPPVAVFRLAQDPDEEEDSEEGKGDVFGEARDEAETDDEEDDVAEEEGSDVTTMLGAPPTALRIKTKKACPTCGASPRRNSCPWKCDENH